MEQPSGQSPSPLPHAGPSNHSNAQPNTLQPAVATVDFAVPSRAPSRAGRHEGEEQGRGDDGDSFASSDDEDRIHGVRDVCEAIKLVSGIYCQLETCVGMI